MKVIGILKPFELEQQIYVYDKGNKIDAEIAKADTLKDIILTFVKKYELNEIELIGPKAYTKGISSQIKEESLTKYDKELKITLV